MLAVTLSACTPSATTPIVTETTGHPHKHDEIPHISEEPLERQNHDTQDTYFPPAVWDAESEAAAIAAAESVMRAYARPDLDHDTWWQAFAPLLNDTTLADYAYLQPSTIQARTVTGGGVPLESSSALLAHIAVPTDIGMYTVLLNRADGESPWQVARISLPEGNQ